MSAREMMPNLAYFADRRNSFPLSAVESEAQRALDLLDQWSAEILRLAAWKAEAMTVLGQWDRVWEAAGKPGLLGDSTAEATLSRVKAWAEMLPVTP